MTGKLPAAVAAVAMAVCAPQAFADATASATLANLTFKLIDLDTTDGVTPMITFTDTSGSHLRSWATTTNPVVSASNSQLGNGVAGAASSSSTVGVFAKGSVTLAGDPFEGSGSAESHASTQPAGASEGFAVAFFGNDGQYNAFTLSAHTELLISVDALLAADAPDAATSDGAHSSLRLTLTSLDGDEPQYSEQFLHADAGGFFYPTSDVKSGHLEVSFSDTSNVSMNGQFYGFVQSLASSQAPAVAAVPEPASGALLLAGLGALTALRRRRAR
jgi:hypothetical protein